MTERETVSVKGRLAVLVGLLVLWGGAISARLYDVQVSEHEKYAERAEDQQHRTLEVHPPRGTIYDARGRTLAVSVAVESACLFPRYIEDPDVAIEKIAAALPAGRRFDREALRARLSENRRFAWVARLLEKETVERLRALDLAGLGFVEESKRYYPMGDMAGPVLGFVGTDHSGLAGLEAQYEKVVAGRSVHRTVVHDALNGTAMAPGLSLLDAEAGADLHLTLDATVQHVVERELRRTVEKHRAKSGTAVLMHPASGAILAMATYPSFDPNHFGRASRQQWRNRAVQDSYEPGSTFKLVTAAAALEGNHLDPVDVLDCEMGAIQLEKARIRDHKPFGLLTFREVIAKSSNVGAIKAGLLAGPEALYAQLRRFGFGELSGIDLPGEETGVVRPVERWTYHADAYASIGQGLSITALQLARAFAAVANDGRPVRPYIVESPSTREGARPEISREVAGPATIRTLIRMLESVVEEGTGRRAAVPGYSVAGKTGTAQKAIDGRYSEDKHIASFAAFAPSRRPAVVAVVVIDEPIGQYHGGDVAAPTVGAILAQVLPYLGVLPEPRKPAIREEPPMATRPFLLAANTANTANTANAQPAAKILQTSMVESRLARATAAGRIPDLQGLTAREAVRVSSQMGLQARLHGSGRVARQVPLPGSPLPLLPTTPTPRDPPTVEVWLSAG